MSVDVIKKFLTDAAAYPDNTLVKFGDTEVPLGSLRALNAGERTELSDRMKKVEQGESDLKTRQQKIVELATKAQAAYDAAEAARVAAGNTQRTPTGDDPWADPWLSPVKGRFEKTDGEVTSLKNQLKEALGSLTSAATIWAEDRWDREYQSIDFGKRDKKPTRDELIEFATKNNIVDRHKMPSVRAAWDKMSEADRLADEKKRSYEEGLEAGRMAAVATRIPAPGVPGPGQAAVMPKSNPNAGDLGDIYGEAMKDPELRQILEQAAGAGIV